MRLVQRFTFVIASVFLVLLCATGGARGWGCAGHMLVAEIAHQHLTPAVRARVDTLAVLFSSRGGFPQSPDFVQSACWADDLRGWGQGAMAGWHYEDVPYNPTDVVLLDEAKAAAVSASSVATAIGHMATALRAGGKANKTVPFFSTAFALFNYVHFFADAHQPLHAATRYAADYPTGDRGGNGVRVRVAGGREYTLHGFWDGMCRTPPLSFHRPLSEAEYQRLRALAASLDADYAAALPQALKRVASGPAIVAESHALAANTTYAGIPLERTDAAVLLSPEYITDCQRTTEERLVLAGHRLARSLNQLLKHSSKDDDDDEDDGDAKEWNFRNALWNVRWKVAFFSLFMISIFIFFF